MSLHITSLNSGSNGNCYYIGNTNEAVLIDVGISCKEVEKRMARLELDIKKVKAIFISHEHSDHIKGVVVLARKYQIPVYITPKTLKRSIITLENNLVTTFEEHQPINIGNLSIIPFQKQHDAIDPYSFIVEGNGVKVGILTDIGSVCKNVIYYFKQCHAAFLETNYDTEMLENGRYPYYLKKRITSGKGHLSNTEALELYKKHKHKSLTHLFLSHLSKENNSPELVEKLFNKHSSNTEIIIASRYNEIPVYTITTKIKEQVLLKRVQMVKQLQIELF